MLNPGFSAAGFEGNLSDESGLVGCASGIAFPQTLPELASLLASAQKAGIPVTIQGARTGICAGAVPLGGHILCLSRLCAVQQFRFAPEAGTGSIRVQAGATFQQIEELLRTKLRADFEDEESARCWALYQQWDGVLHFPYAPSEETASVGGAVATDAVSSRILSGSMANSLHALALALPGGEIVEIKKGTTLSAALPGRCPPLAAEDGAADAITVICGSEGAAGVIAAATLELQAKPAFVQGLMSYHHSYADMEQCARALWQQVQALPGAQVLAADWFAPACWQVLAQEKDTLPAVQRLPTPPPQAIALWVELAATDEAHLQTLLYFALEWLECHGCFADEALAVQGAAFQPLQGMRHLLTEAANRANGEGLPVVLDYIAPEGQHAQVAQLAAQTLASAQATHTLMGHACVGHVNVRIMGNGAHHVQLVQQLTNAMAALGCHCSSEHGIGRAKAELLRQLCPERAAQLKRLRAYCQTQLLDVNNLI